MANQYTTPVPVAERFAAFTKRCEVTGCLIWTGATRKASRARRYRGGHTLPHGRFNLHGKARSAHRVSYMLYHGFSDCTIADFGLLEHGCDNPRCVEPTHLFESDHSANLQSAYDRGRRKPAPEVALAELFDFFDSNPMYATAAE